LEKSFTPSTSGKDALINSGKIDLLEPDLTYIISQYYELCSMLAEREYISNTFIREKYETYFFEQLAAATTVTDAYGISEKYADDPREKYLIPEELLIDNDQLEVRVLVRLVHSEEEKELYTQIIEKAKDLRDLLEKEY
jgi:hypothetical protein